MPDWTAARAEMMLDPTVVNLNTGSFGPSPRPVFDRVTELRRHQAAEPMDFILRATPPLLWHARERLSEYLGTRPSHLVFTQNVSAAVNIVAAGLPLADGEIVLSDREYGAMHMCWERAAARRHMPLRTFHLPLMPESVDALVDAIEAALTPQTRLLFFSHVYSATGIVLPAREICELARRRGIMTVVDGAHAPAQVALAIDEVGADFYCGNCHKWMLAPIGAGFLAAWPEMLERLEPLQASWGYRPVSGDLDRPDEFGSTPRIRRLEFEGTRDVCPWLAVPAAIDFQTRLGGDAIRSRLASLASYCRRLDGFNGLRLTTPAEVRLHGAMTAFRIPAGRSAEELRAFLWSRRIEVPVFEWPDGRMIRLSTHFYTTENEVDQFQQTWAAFAGA